MKSHGWLTFFVLTLVLAVLCADRILGQKPVKAPNRDHKPTVRGRGYVPPPFDMSHLKPPEFLRTMQLPESWDWRALGGVTPVKDQGEWGTCWAFAAIGDLESKVLIGESETHDYSELNVVACNAYAADCTTGGNEFISTSYFTLFGSVDEACDPYPAGCPDPACINPACTFFKQVAEWRCIPENRAAIKYAVMNYGPVYSAMSIFDEFEDYDGTYCLTLTDPWYNLDHAVLIVGWDDGMCGGNGGWIVKNSWGTDWGDEGYFYIQYEHAGIGLRTNVITDYKDHNPDETICYYDTCGMVSTILGTLGMVEITPPYDTLALYAVDIWMWSPGPYEINVYDDYNPPTDPYNLLSGPVSGVVTEAGYYSIELPTPVSMDGCGAIYLVLEADDFNVIPMDNTGTHSGKSFFNIGGFEWWPCDGDVCIRGRFAPPPPLLYKEGDPAFYLGFPVSSMEVRGGETHTFTVHPANFAFASDLCPYTDTFCVYATDLLGWAISSDPPLNNCEILDPGDFFYQDIQITVPCEASPGQINTVDVTVTYCHNNGVCAPHGDCEDPNIHDSSPYYSTTTLDLLVVESPPALHILQDSLSNVWIDRIENVLFSICNSDVCAPPTDYDYVITSEGHIGSPINESGTASDVPGGDCKDVYVIVDLEYTNECDMDTLTIVAWDAATGTVYDTCVQVIHVVVPEPVPLFTMPWMTILVLALILSVSFFMKRRVANSR